LSEQPTHHTTTANGVRLHFVTAGAGEPVVLLHGWPQTWYEWHRVIPLLAPHHHVIAPDLRGMGDSGRPADGYDKRTVAEDIHALLAHLGIGAAHIVGHDIGSAVAYAYAAAHRTDTLSLTVMEMLLPGLGLEAAFNITRTGGRWHHVLHARSELAEFLIRGKERAYISWFFRTFAYDPTAIPEADIDEYERAIRAPGALRASLEHYRAFFDDAERNVETAKEKLGMPVLALGGELNHADRLVPMMQCAAHDVRGGAVARCGHWIPEERPQELAETLLAFFAEAGRRERRSGLRAAAGG